MGLLIEMGAIYSTVQKFFNVSERGLFCSARLNLFDQKYSKNCEILLELKTAVFYVNIC